MTDTEYVVTREQIARLAEAREEAQRTARLATLMADALKSQIHDLVIEAGAHEQKLMLGDG